MLLNHYLIAPEIVTENFDNETIIVNLSRGHYYSLRNLSFDIWQGFEAGLPANTLLTYLTDAYHTIEANVLQQSFHDFLRQLVTEGLLIEGVPNQTNELPPFPARPTFVAPALEIYTDMADLLTLDPIHDVNPVEGWPIKK